MLRLILLAFSMIILLASCNNGETDKHKTQTNETMVTMPDSTSGYAPINGLNMYYEIYGKGMPLVLIHGGGSTIQTSFAQVIPFLARKHQVIAVELQGHGRTSHRDSQQTFEQDADDVAALLQYLKISNADIFGFSNGGNATMQIAVRHPELVRKIVIGSSFYKRAGMYPQFWEFMPNATLENMPRQLADAYKALSPDPNDLIKMFNNDKNRMVSFKDWDAGILRSIKAPAFILIGDQDVMLPEHAVEMSRLIPNARLAILPGAHGAYIGEITTGMENSKLPELTVAMIEDFLNDTTLPKE